MQKHAFIRFSWRSLIAIIVLGPILFQTAAVFVYAQGVSSASTQEVDDLNQQIADKNTSVKTLTDQAAQYDKLIQEKESAKTSLANELSLIENQIKKQEIDIESKNDEIDATNLKIRQNSLQIDDKQTQIDQQKTELSALMRDINRQDQSGRLEILLTNDSISKFFGYLKQLDDVQSNLRVALTGVQDAKRDLEVFQYGLEQDKTDLQTLLLELEIAKQKLDEQKQAKVALIDETNSSEQEFQKHLAEIRSQQREANAEIQQLQDQVKQKLSQVQQKDPSFVENPSALQWPIPNQGINTYFHDPSYPFRNIVGEHSGIDLRTIINGKSSMGVPVHAAASGVVVKVLHNGQFTGNAVYISHGDALMTIYMHLSVVYAKADDVVDTGTLIGLSGGAPGDPGAGLSSGPHLHFEVRKDGIPVDPCPYLNPSC